MIALATGVIGLFTAGSILSMRMPSLAILRMLAPDGEDVRQAMVRTGLFAESLAAAGATAADIPAIVSDATDYLVANNATWIAADGDLKAARASVEHYARLVRRGQRDSQTLDALSTARSDLTSATSSMNTLLNGFYQDAVSTLGSSQTAVLATLKGQLGWTIPVEYLCASWTEAERLELRNALAHVRIAADSGEAVDPDVALFIADCDGEPEVATARVNLTTHGALVEQALNNALDF